MRADGVETLTLAGIDGDPLPASIRWSLDTRASRSTTWPEIATQATSGLMALHGVDSGAPRRLGLDVVSGAAATLAGIAVMAALVARRRGLRVEGVETEAAGAAMLMLGHHLAGATCGDPWKPPVGGAGPGPPFPTADGHWVELEVLGPDRWGTFWRRLGVDGPELGPAWLAFAFRHNTARCRLPPAMHEATARHSLARLRATADACGVALVRVRGYDEVRADWTPGQAPWHFGVLGPGDDSADGTVIAADAERRSSPLAGVRVVEVTSRIQGPMAGRVLAMLGAEVIRVEPPGGDPARDAPPTAGAVGAPFVTYNHGKRAVELDYKSSKGRAELFDLVRDADVFLHNWRAGRAHELALTSDDVARVRRDIVYAHASGWGAVADPTLPSMATDYLVQAHAGCGAGLNPDGEPPFPSRLTIVDLLGGLVAAEAIVGALLLRELTGRACTVDSSLLSSTLDLQDDVLTGISSGVEKDRHRGRPVWGPLQRPLATADAYIVLDAGDATSLRKLARACSAADDDVDAIARSLRAESTTLCIERLRAADVCAIPVRTDLAGVARDPLYVAAIEHIDGVCSVVAAPWCFDIAGGS